MEAFDIQKIRHLLPDGIDEDLLSDLYRHTCETKQEMRDKVPANAMLADVEQFKQLIDQLRPYLQNGFSSAKAEKRMVAIGENLADFFPEEGDGYYDVQKNRQVAIAALDRLRLPADHVAVGLWSEKSDKGRPKMIERDVLLYRLYAHLLKRGCKDGEAKIRTGKIMMVWGLPVPGCGSDDRTAIKNIGKAINRGKQELEEREAFESGDYALG